MYGEACPPIAIYIEPVLHCFNSHDLKTLVLAFICLCVSCRWCPTAFSAFRRCKVTTRLPFPQEVSNLVSLPFRPAVQSGCSPVCARSHAYRSGRGTQWTLWPPHCATAVCIPRRKVNNPTRLIERKESTQSLQLTFITSFGVKHNIFSSRMQSEVTLADLFV